MSLVQKVAQIVNKRMNTEAQQILDELREACPKRSGKTAESFHIMGGGEDATVSVSGQGLIKSVRIGSTLLSAKYADEGNGGSGREIRSTRRYDRNGIPPAKLKLSDGTYRVMVHGYEGTHFVREVANRHR